MVALHSAPYWLRAARLSERIPGRPQTPNQTELGHHRFERWRSQPPFDTDGWFEQRLKSENLDEEGLRALLGESAEELASRLGPLAWQAALSAMAKPESRGFLDDSGWQPHHIGLLRFVEGPIHEAHHRLVRALAHDRTRRKDLFEPEIFAGMWLSVLPSRLLPLVSRAVVSELHIARLEGRLEGATPEQRFQQFTDQLREPDRALSLLAEYPVLARQVLQAVDLWVEAGEELGRRLGRDASVLRRFFGEDPGPLTELSGDRGDRHFGGRSVVILRFETGHRVVYKPRPLTLDARFQDLLTWLNRRGLEPALRTLERIERPGYGWVEFVAASGCSTEEEVRRFYQRQGAYLALFWWLHGNDVHQDNLIASGEHPMPVDLETLFHPRNDGGDPCTADPPPAAGVYDTVLTVGLLPHRIWESLDGRSVDFSGLGAPAEQPTPQAVLQIEDIGTDRMHYVRKPAFLRGSRNHPTLNGEPVSAGNYADDVEQGFVNAIRLLVRHREDLLASDGLLQRFADAEVRVIARPTRSYSLLLNESYHPFLLRDALDRQRHFDRLWVAVDVSPHIIPLIPWEQEDLERGDVPVFTTRAGSRSLWTSTGQELPEFLGRSGIERSRERLQTLDEDEIERQRRVVCCSLQTLRLEGWEGNAREPWPSTDVLGRLEPLSRERAIQEAMHLGDRLAKVAFRRHGRASWMGFKPPFNQAPTWTYVPLGLDLYDGIPGIALFLAHLGTTTGKARYLELARESLATILDQVDASPRALASVGAFSGWAGLVYVFDRLAVLLDRPDLLKRAEEVALALEPLMGQDTEHDVVSGAAGCLVPLLRLYRNRPTTRLLQLAITCGERLLETAQPQERGHGWLLDDIASKPLTGFSHGNAGIAWSLLELAAVCGDRRFYRAALDAFEYERALFDPDRRNWPDLREGHPEGDGHPHFVVGWCHGAAGIGLGRLACLPLLDESHRFAAECEIRDALATTRSQGFGRDHSLCHGDLGNLDLLIGHALWSASEKLLQEARRYGTALLGSSPVQWHCGWGHGLEPPGLLVGLAGMGLGLLRLAEPERIPSVLLLQTDPSAGTHAQPRDHVSTCF